MKQILFSVLLLSVYNVTNGRAHPMMIPPIYDTIIAPLLVDDVQNETIKREVISIFRGDTKDSLYEHMTKGREIALATSYKREAFGFYIEFPQKIVIGKKAENIGAFKINFPSNKSPIDYLRFSHFKYMLIFSPRSLSVINREILNLFGEKSVTCEVKSFISKDRLRNYLHLSIGDGNKRGSYIFIINENNFYECVKSRA